MVSLTKGEWFTLICSIILDKDLFYKTKLILTVIYQKPSGVLTYFKLVWGGGGGEGRRLTGGEGEAYYRGQLNGEVGGSLL